MPSIAPPSCRLALLVALQLRAAVEDANQLFLSQVPPTLGSFLIQMSQASVQALRGAIARRMLASGAAPGLSAEQAEAAAEAQALGLRPCASLGCTNLDGSSETVLRGRTCTGCGKVRAGCRRGAGGCGRCIHSELALLS